MNAPRSAKATPRRRRQRVRAQRTPPKPQAAATPATTAASQTSREPPKYWEARASWLGVPDVPSFVNRDDWTCVVKAGKVARNAPKGLGAAIVATIRGGDQPAKGFVLQDALACQPRFFPSTAGIWIVHASGTSPSKNWDAIFWAEKQDGAWHVSSYGFKSEAVHQLNTRAPLVLDGEYLSYLRYFMHIVRAELGAFRLIDRPEWAGRTWPFSPESMLRRLVRRKRSADAAVPPGEPLTPPTFDGIDASGRLRYRVQVMYGGHLFAAEMALAQTGMVEMVNDRPLMEAAWLTE